MPDFYLKRKTKIKQRLNFLTFASAFTSLPGSHWGGRGLALQRGRRRRRRRHRRRRQAQGRRRVGVSFISSLGAKVYP